MSGYNAVVNDDGTWQQLKADIAIDSEKKLAQIINLGSKAGKFEISSTEPEKIRDRILNSVQIREKYLFRQLYF